MNIEKRLDRIEAAVGDTMPVDEEADRRQWLGICGALLETMDERHARLVCEEVERAGKAQQSSEDVKFAGLTKVFLEMAGRQYRGTFDKDRPFALPAPICEVYLAYPVEAFAADECEDCGLKVPVKCALPFAEKIIETCPLCGGAVGCCARYHKRQREKSIAGGVR